MRELTINELEEVNGALLANIGMAIVGAAGAMASYAIGGAVSGKLSGSGFAGAATTGAVTGFGGFTPQAAYVGAAAGAAVASSLSDE